jgi:hypothetical protein
MRSVIRQRCWSALTQQMLLRIAVGDIGQLTDLLSWARARHSCRASGQRQGRGPWAFFYFHVVVASGLLAVTEVSPRRAEWQVGWSAAMP